MSASMSVNIRRTTLPLPWCGSVKTSAPAPRAISTVRSFELLSNTKIVAVGSAALKSATTFAIDFSSL